MILFVCTGNTCRSPMAEAIYNSLVGDKRAFSRGIAVAFPTGAADNAKTAVTEYGGNLDNHKSQQITPEDIAKAELIITMTEGHKHILSQYAENSKIMTLSEFAGVAGDVSDPYGGSIDIYLKTAEQIYSYVKKGISKRSEVLIADEKDLKAVAEMEKAYFPDSWSENAVRAEIERKRVAVLKYGEILIGYCIFMIAADEGEILRIAIDRSMRLGKMGKKLLSDVISLMQGMNCSEVFLEVRASNTPAISLYRSLGFVEIGVRKGYYRDNGEDAVLFNFKIKER